MSRTLHLGSISTRRERIAKLAREVPGRSLHSLCHYIDVYWLEEAFHRIRRDGAPGVDGQTWAEYNENRGANLRDLLDRFHKGHYRAPPVRRRHIPKGDPSKGTRPIGIPTLEDKVLQKAVAMVLESIYEQDFLDCSYGYRAGRSAHDALGALWEGTMKVKGGWILEVDIRSFFDELDHRHLRSFLDKRVRDGVLRRTIDKWLKAGVMEEGVLSYPKSGSPQGGVISPWLANIYLHEVIDRWYTEEVRPLLRGRSQLIRFADDAVFVFANERDARRVAKALPKRLGRFGLRLHPDKTRLLDFRRDRGGPPGPPRDQGPRSFDFLGFTHYWGRSRRGTKVVKRKTAASRLSRFLSALRHWCRRYRHAKVPWQQQQLIRKLRGHYAYYGITGNSRSLGLVHHETERIWRKWLNRRSQKARMNWERFGNLLRRYPLPRPRIVHSVYRP